LILRINHSSGVPLYLQIVEQVKHAVETAAIRAGDQLPTIRQVAVGLVMNPNTVVRAYRELEYEGVIELKHGSGAYVRESAGNRAQLIRKARGIVETALERLEALGLKEDEIRRVFESELSQAGMKQKSGR
jgi:GntR family transcriptional regulator